MPHRLTSSHSPFFCRKMPWYKYATGKSSNSIFCIYSIKKKLTNHCSPTAENKQLIKKTYWKTLTNKITLYLRIDVGCFEQAGFFLQRVLPQFFWAAYFRSSEIIQLDFTIDKPVIVINGFQKKSQKTPRREIILAQRIKKLYFDEKE